MVENSETPDKTPPQITPAPPKKSALDTLIAFYNRSRSFSRLALYKIGHIEKANMELGIRQLKRGNFFDAALRFKFVLWMNKSNVIAYYLLGKSYFYRGKLNEAVAPLKAALRLDPELEEAKFLLACCGQGADIKIIPRSFIIDKLDFIAAGYEQYVENTSSHVNAVLATELPKFLSDKMGFNVLDLGCRGGDSSQVLRKVANSITGVEPCIKLVGIARNRRVENLLALNLIISKFPEDYLKDAQEKFSVILSTYYLNNLGVLDNYFTQVTKLLDKGSLFAFNINRNAGGQDYFFKPGTFTFAHSPQYIEKLMTKNTLKILAAHEVKYANGNVDIVYITEKQ